MSQSPNPSLLFLSDSLNLKNFNHISIHWQRCLSWTNQPHTERKEPQLESFVSAIETNIVTPLESMLWRIDLKSMR
jgi:hypothetical protein